MATVIEPIKVEERAAPWHPATRMAFRFCFLYMGLYIVLTQMLTSILFAATNDNGAWELDESHAAQAVMQWIGRHVFHLGHAMVAYETGSGDRQYDWVELAGIFFLAVVGTVVWSWLDRKRTAYPGLYKWFRLAVRFALGATLLTYGAAKIIPLQMPYPPLGRLLERYGDLSPMGVLWASIGAAPGYEIFAGAMELVAGILLFIPEMATLGAMIGLADGVQVFMLNMTYDVPVKLLAFHLIPFSLFLLAPDARRLLNVIVLNRRAEPAPERRLFRGHRACALAYAAQIVFGVYLLAGNLYGSVGSYSTYGPGRPKSALYGIWNVTSFTYDGQSLPPLLTDTRRWRRVVFDSPRFMVTYGMEDGEAHGYGVSINASARTMEVSTLGKSPQKTELAFTQPAPNQLTISGELAGHHIVAALELHKPFQLVSRGFHWVQDRPYNR